MLESDIIVCVQVYPESGDQATVHFLNMAFAKASPNPDVQVLYTEVCKALKTNHKIGQMDFDVLCDVLEEKCWVNPPCFVGAAVTMYEK